MNQETEEIRVFNTDGGGFRFLNERGLEFRTLNYVMGEKFQSYWPVENRIFGLIDDSHTALTDF